MSEGGITVLVDAFAEIADAAEGHARGQVSEDDEVWMEEEETTRSRWRQYVQSGQDEVSDRDEWAEIHYGSATSRTTPRRPRYCKIYTKYAYASRQLCQKFLQIAVINVQLVSVEKQGFDMQNQNKKGEETDKLVAKEARKEIQVRAQ